ncbi:hypothetical protein [Salinivibrio phage CW02]|uniref:Uncharacterized protein n=1 Tax=Salinivibrio phage CW02 TaxID=1161935 RepID=H9D1I9_9CAUD|nr:hypothetical protein F490_gp06 [Salinivibrio phage CW02]AFE86231.1 hypothetical protein [Salinivibrio phage CW02]
MTKVVVDQPQKDVKRFKDLECMEYFLLPDGNLCLKTWGTEAIDLTEGERRNISNSHVTCTVVYKVRITYNTEG